MKIEAHEEAYKEHIEKLKRAIEEGVEENQRNIGFNISQGSVELFAIYLHKLNLLSGSGDQFDNRAFKSKNLIEQKIQPELPEKEKILKLMEHIELERIALCYGTRKPKSRIESAIKYFNELRRRINSNLKNVKKK